MNDLPESTLITQARSGDSTAFGELVLRNQTDVFNVCYRLTGNRQDAEDLAQETFIRAHRKLHTFAPGYTFGPWIRKIAANICLNELKKHYRKTEQVDPDDHEWRFASSAPGPGAIAETQFQAERVREAILALPPTYRAVIELRHYQDMRYQEIADTLEIPLDHVKSYLFRARKKLAGMLEDER
jgi:RNA polymerase sigma-70 factor (ECF subfamily)